MQAILVDWFQAFWRRRLWLAAALFVVLLWSQLTQVGDFRVDDAYISFSFAKNLAAGNGIVFSHGLKVEGYSNFLWVVLMSLGYLVRPAMDPYRWARILGIVSLVFAAYLAYRHSRKHAGSWLSLGAVFLALANTDLARAAMSGLETMAYVASFGFAWGVFALEDPDRRRWSFYAFLPVALLRIDGFVPAVAALVFDLVDRILKRKLDLKTWARWALPPIALWAGYFAWRYAYYGLPLPLPYYAKQFVEIQEPDRGFHQVWAFLHESGGYALVPFMLLGLVRGPRRASFALATGIGCQLLHVGLVGGDWMPFHRFLLPIVIPSVVLFAWGSARLWEEARLYKFEVRGAVVAALCFVIFFVGRRVDAESVETPEEKQKLGEVKHTYKHTRENLLGVANLMAQVIRKPGDKLVTDYAGVFSVTTDATVIDMWGLCEPDIALNGGINGIVPIYGKECAECYARIQPDYFHTIVPIVRSPQAFHDITGVVAQIFQGWAIDRVIGLRKNFAVGRVREEFSQRALWFLERRKPGVALVPRHPLRGITVDYPFEPGGTEGR